MLPVLLFSFTPLTSLTGETSGTGLGNVGCGSSGSDTSTLPGHLHEVESHGEGQTCKERFELKLLVDNIQTLSNGSEPVPESVSCCWT